MLLRVFCLLGWEKQKQKYEKRKTDREAEGIEKASLLVETAKAAAKVKIEKKWKIGGKEKARVRLG